MKALLTLALVIGTCSYFVVAGSDNTELCRILKDGTQFRRPETCNEYVKCQNQSAEIYSCITPFNYDRNSNACVETLSDCDANYCDGINGKWVANPHNCQGFFYCNKGVAYAGACDDEYHFNEAKQACVFATTSDCYVVPNVCDFLPDKTLIADKNDCTVYYECNKGKKTKKTCKNTYFDVENGNCVDKSMVPCTKHPLPKNICGTEKKPVTGFKSDKATCRGYFYCRNFNGVPDLEPIWGQCPEGTFFNEKKSVCDDPINSYCIYNRCQGISNQMISSSRNNCRNYIICKDGIPVEERTCSGDKFFDERMQACVPYPVSYGCCDGQK